MIVIQVTTPAGIKFHDGGTGTRTYLYPPLEHIVDVPSNQAFIARLGAPVVVSWEQYVTLGGS